MITLRIILISLFCLFFQYVQAQEKQEKSSESGVNQSMLMGYHFGFVNVFCSVKNGDLRWQELMAQALGFCSSAKAPMEQGQRETIPECLSTAATSEANRG